MSQPTAGRAQRRGWRPTPRVGADSERPAIPSKPMSSTDGYADDRLTLAVTRKDTVRRHDRAGTVARHGAVGSTLGRVP